jgi:hypothetical protein
MSISRLIGLRLEACRFSKGSYTFEFSGMKNEEFHYFSVSTSNCFSAHISKKVDALENISLGLWKFLECELTGVREMSQSCEVIFEFGDAGEFVVWADSSPIDNLLIVKDRETGEWFTVL